MLSLDGPVINCMRMNKALILRLLKVTAPVWWVGLSRSKGIPSQELKYKQKLLRWRITLLDTAAVRTLIGKWLSAATLCSDRYYSTTESAMTVKCILPVRVCLCIWISCSCKILFLVANRAAPSHRLQLPEKDEKHLSLCAGDSTDRKWFLLVGPLRTTPKMPTPDPIAVSVGIILNFLAWEGFKKRINWYKTFFDFLCQKYVWSAITHQWLHDDIYSDPKHFEKGPFLNLVLKIVLCVPNKQTLESSQYCEQRTLASSVW